MEIHGKKSEHTDLRISLFNMFGPPSSFQQKLPSSTKLGPELGICGHGAHPKDMPRKTVEMWKPFQPNATQNDEFWEDPQKIVTIVAF